ncbi:MAG: M64 family metallopeptidase [Phycisphaerales bacterium]
MRHALGIGSIAFGHFALALPPEPGEHREVGRVAESCIVTEPTLLDRSEMDALTPIPAPVYRLDTKGNVLEVLDPVFRDRGLANNRVNLVFVGDGYLSSQLGQYAIDVQSGAARLFSYEPFKTYQNFFGIYRVDVVSQVSGVSNDPTNGINRNTPLQMAFWCNGIDRLLCVNTTAARQYANNAPFPPDQVLAVANSLKYGGAGYGSVDVGTYAGSNSAAPEVAVHEFGHAFADLADEYEYDGPTTHVQSEPSAVDVSIFTKTQMLAQSKKWYRWIGINYPEFDGLHDCYEGGDHSYFGIYRPSPDSMMRNLQRPFNLPSAEAIIGSIYKLAKPVESTSPEALTTVTRTSLLSVTLLQLIGHGFKIEWLVGSQVIAGQSATSFDLSTFNFRKGANTVRCRITDETLWVRNPITKASLLTQEKKWYITVAPCLGDLSGDRVVDDADFTYFVAAYNELLTNAGDMNGDGLTDDADFSIFAQQYDALECP